MENIVAHLPKYVIALFVEILVFGCFVFLASTKTKDETSRRWKASSLASILFGILVHLCFTVIIILSWVSDTNTEEMSMGLGDRLFETLSATIGLATIITMPVIIIGIFVAYYNFLKTGDRLIEKYWKNPKIHYEEDAKPPYLKF